MIHGYAAPLLTCQNVRCELLPVVRSVPWSIQLSNPRFTQTKANGNHLWSQHQPTKHTFLIMTKLRFPWINCQQLYDMTTWKLQLHSKRVWVRIGYTFKWLRSFTILQISSSILCGFCWAFDIFWHILTHLPDVRNRWPVPPSSWDPHPRPIDPSRPSLATPHLHPCRLGVSRRFRKRMNICSMFLFHVS